MGFQVISGLKIYAFFLDREGTILDLRPHRAEVFADHTDEEELELLELDDESEPPPEKALEIAFPTAFAAPFTASTNLFAITFPR